MGFNTAYFVAWVIVFIFGVSLEKFLQAFVAGRLGDSSPRSKGRLRLNPAAHHEPLGLVFAFFLSLGTFGVTAISWGRPVEVDVYRIRGGRLGRSLVALVGPLTYFGLAFVIWLATKGFILGSPAQDFLPSLFYNIIYVSLIMCAFNLIPLYPLDGYDILRGFLPAAWEPKLAWIEKYGILVIIVLVMIIPFFLRINILFQFYVAPIVKVLASLLGITGIQLS